VGVRPPHGFHSEEETFSRLRKPQDPGFTDEGIFFKNQPHNSLQRGIEPGWLRPYLSSTSQLGLEGFGAQYTSLWTVVAQVPFSCNAIQTVSKLMLLMSFANGELAELARCYHYHSHGTESRGCEFPMPWGKKSPLAGGPSFEWILGRGKP
jgi:hypothetical protein